MGKRGKGQLLGVMSSKVIHRSPVGVGWATVYISFEFGPDEESQGDLELVGLGLCEAARPVWSNLCRPRRLFSTYRRCKLRYVVYTGCIAFL